MNSETIKILYNQVKELNAADGHIKLEQIYKDNESTAVISVYRGIKPSHEVLSELYDWAEELGLDDITNKIKELEEISTQELN